MDDLLAHFTAAARPGRGEENCSCCRATGEHDDRSECDRCDGSGRMHRGDDAALPWCPGRENDQPAPPKRRHWREPGTAARRDPWHGEGPWYHGTPEDLEPGAVIQPGDVIGKQNMGRGSDSARAWVTNDAWKASSYGTNVYEVEPGTRPKSMYARHHEHYLPDGGTATVLRKVPYAEATELSPEYQRGKKIMEQQIREYRRQQHEAMGSVGDYGIHHRPMEIGAPMHDLTGQAPDADFDTTSYLPDDYLTHRQYHTDSPIEGARDDAEALAQMRRAQGKPDALVSIYRASHHSAPHEMNTGDWVTLSRRYAHKHAEASEAEVQEDIEGGSTNPGLRPGQWVVHHARVPARHVRDAGSGGYREQGYWGPTVACCGHEKTAVLPAYGPEPKYDFAPEDWPPEKRDVHNQAMFDKRTQWKAHIQRGLSLGHLTADQAKEYGYYPSGHATESGSGRSLWQPLPHEMYHVTTDEPGVRAHGLKTRAELNQISGHGLGGGEDDTISVTTDRHLAHGILGALHEFHGVVNGKYTPKQMWEDAKAGKGADHPYHEGIANYWKSGWKDGDELPRGLHNTIHGIHRDNTMGSSQEMIDKVRGPGWRPARDDEGWMSGHKPPQKMHAWWEKDMDPDQRRENAASFYKHFAIHRQMAGGPEDPMFFATDTRAFAAKDPRHFAMLHVRPRPGAQGYPLGGMSEWRTGTGDALQVHHAEHAEPQQHHEGSAVDFEPYSHLKFRTSAWEKTSTAKGLYWRAHVRSQPFDEQHARSVEQGEEGRPGQRGYSAFKTPHQLGRYMDKMGWLDGYMMGGRDVLHFHGHEVGRGADNEPLVIPKADPSCCGKVVHDRMSWDDLENRIWGPDNPEVPYHEEHVSDPVPKSVERHRRRHGARIPRAERTESVAHMLSHYRPYDFDTWAEARDNIVWDHPRVRDFVADIARNGVKRPIPVDYEQDPPQVRNGHTRLLAAERAGIETVPTRQHEGFMDPDDPDHLGRGPDDPDHWTNQPGWNEREGAIRQATQPYSMQHEGPDPGEGEGLHEIGSGKIWPKDFHERSWEYRLDADDESMDKVRGSRDWPSRKVWAYRALPSPHREVNTGDWVSTSRRYARSEGRASSNPDDDYPVVKFQARAEHLRNEGNSLDEWSYTGPKVNRALVHFSGGKNHRNKGGRGKTDAMCYEHEPPEMFSQYEQANRERREKRKAEREAREHQAARQREGDEKPFGDYTMRYHQEDQGERRPRHVIETRHPQDGKVGELNWYGTTGVIHNLDVEEDHSRKGIATAMWSWGQEMFPRPKHSGDRTPMGREWAKSVGGPGLRRRQAVLPMPGMRNPHTGGDEWFHGTRAYPEELSEHGFSDPMEFDSGAFEQPDAEPQGHWNSLLGTHFTADHDIAKEFALGEHSSGANDRGQDPFRGEARHVLHARLGLHNPKVYDSEHDMDHEAYEHEHAAGNHPVNHVPQLGSDDPEDRYEAEEMWPGTHMLHQQYGTRKIPAKAQLAGHPVRTNWLNSHPDRWDIADRYRRRLQAQGHDGIIYGNEYEHSKHGGEANKSAIVFDPGRIQVTQRHHAYADHLDPEEAEHQQARMPSAGQQELFSPRQGAARRKPLQPGQEECWKCGVRADKSEFTRGSVYAPVAGRPMECTDKAACSQRRAEGRRTAANYRGKFRCKDCGWDTNSAEPGVRTENYAVHSDVWHQAGMDKMGGNLCVGCLEKRLGRQLHAGDFPAVPVNDLSAADTEHAYTWRTDRLKDRIQRTAARDPYIAPPQAGDEMWRHLQEAHGVGLSAGSTRTPRADFTTDLHRRFHGGQTADQRQIPHQHEEQGTGQSRDDAISRLFTPDPPGVRKRRRPDQPKPERLDDREYSIRDVSRHYDWEGFDPHEIGHLVHQPEHATFTKEDVPVWSLRHVDEHGSLKPPPSYQDIASQGEDERERLKGLESADERSIPPIVVVRHGKHHIIADGSHRAAIYARHGYSHIPAFVTQRTIFPGQRTAAWVPKDRIFGPTYGLDRRLFTAGEELKPEVRQALLGRLQGVLEPLLGPAWDAVTRVYLAGSEASRWTSPELVGNGDLDVLIGVAYTYARNEAPALEKLTDLGIDKHLNALLQQHFNAPGWHPPFGPDDTYDLTGYVNHNALDIRAISPYAAYDLTNGEWAVKPPDLPGWSAEQFPQGPALMQEARALIAQVRAILRLPEPFRTQEASRIWDSLHQARGEAFSAGGLGWQGTGNVLEKALDQASGGLVEKLKQLKYGPADHAPAALGHGMTTADLGSAHA